MTIVESLKTLAATMKGSGTATFKGWATAADIPGETVSDVVEWITANWAAIKAEIKK